MTQTLPPGLVARKIQHRFVNDGDGGPITFDRKTRTVDACISRGSPVQRFYGTEVLQIDRQSVITDRLTNGGIPVLDSHNQVSAIGALGKVQRIWFSAGSLMGRLKFNDTAEGRKASGMVERGELTGISAGYRVLDWSITDEDGNAIDAENVRWDDDGLTFRATRWELLECSIVSISADSSASIRSLGGGNSIANVRARMRARQMIHETRTRMRLRQTMSDRMSDK
jgi:phage head maturation protease